MKKIILFLTLILILTGCAVKLNIKQAAQPDNRNNMSLLTDKNILIVIAPKDFRDAEYIEPRKVIENSGAKVKVASIQGGTSIGAEGTKVNIDLTISEVDVEDFNAVAFIGGPGMAEIVNDESLHVLAKKFYEAGKITAAICVAPAILAYAGILDGKQATAWPGVKQDLINKGANYTGNAVTVDGRIITANGPVSARQFGEKIIENLK